MGGRGAAGPASMCSPRGPGRRFVPSPAAPRPGYGMRLRGGSGTCLIGASRRGSEAIGSQIESRCSGPIAKLRVVRETPCSMRIDLKADLSRLTTTARLLLCTQSGPRPQRPSDRPQYHNQAGLGQAQPAGGHGPAVPHHASAGDDWVTAIEEHLRRFAPDLRTFRGDDRHGEVPRASRKSPVRWATEGAMEWRLNEWWVEISGLHARPKH